MILIRIAPLPTLHARMTQEARSDLVTSIRASIHGPLPRRPYAVAVDLFGRWNDSKGRPLERNTDNVVKCILDVIAEAAGFGRNGRGDQFLDRTLTIRATHTDGTDMAMVTLI